MTNSLKKIISGGRPGVEQAALDFAVESQMPYGGWVEKGSTYQPGTMDETYQLQEIPSRDARESLRKNMIGSDGTLIISQGRLPERFDITQSYARRESHPLIHIDLSTLDTFPAAEKICEWIGEHNIEVLHITGPSYDINPQLFKKTKDILETVTYLDIILLQGPGRVMPRPFEDPVSPVRPPESTLEDVVASIISTSTFRERTRIANLSEDQLADLAQTLEPFISQQFRLAGNVDLWESCRKFSGNEQLTVRDAVFLITKHLWINLKKKKNILKVVK